MFVTDTDQFTFQALPALGRAPSRRRVYPTLGLPEREGVLLDLPRETDGLGVEVALYLHRAVRKDDHGEAERPVDLPPEGGREVEEPELEARAEGFEDGPAVLLQRPGPLGLPPSPAPAPLRPYDDFIDLSEPYDSYEVPDSGTPTPDDGLFEQYAVRFVGAKSGEAPTIETRSEAQRALLLLLLEEGINDFPRVPVDDTTSQRLYERYAAFLEQRTNTLRTLIEERTADPDLQGKATISC